jgi:glycosyltransferase involved in cell wall biosynthesis
MVIGMIDSPHVARWLASLIDLPIDFVLFPSTPNRRIHPGVSALVTGSSNATVRLSGFEARVSLAIWACDLVVAGRLRAWLLRRRIGQFSPDLLHALELQHAGYLVLKATREHERASRPPLALTNYGSDLFWFRRFPRHSERLEALLSLADYYFAECERDVHLARELGFAGREMTVLPNAGGIPSDVLSSKPDADGSRRNIILIKGYTNFVGRAQDILRELGRRAAEFEGWEIVVYSSTWRAQLLCRWIKASNPALSLTALPKRHLSHDEMLALFRKSAVYIGFSKSDGISTSFLEALACGAYPMQTSTACVDEWRAKGAVFSSLDVGDAPKALDELLRVLGDRRTLEHSARKNAEVAARHLDEERIARQVEEDYRLIVGLE